jgi:hypothetical protein
MHISHALFRTHDWRIAACRDEQVRIVHHCVKAHTANAISLGHKLVFVASSKLAKNCDKTKLDHFVKTGRGGKQQVPVVIL